MFDKVNGEWRSEVDERSVVECSGVGCSVVNLCECFRALSSESFKP